jgi:hypothetical protein
MNLLLRPIATAPIRGGMPIGKRNSPWLSFPKQTTPQTPRRNDDDEVLLLISL